MSAEFSAGLKALHALLSQLSDAEAALADGPRMISVAEKQVVAAEKAIDDQKQAIKTAKKASDDVNLRLKTREADILKLQGQLNTASSNKEYDIIKGQIAGAKTDKGDLEEQGLNALDSVDSAQNRLKELETELTRRKQQVQSLKNDFQTRKPQLDAMVASLQAQIQDAEKIVPGSELAMWRRLRGAHGAGALSALEDDFCGACSNRVTSQDQVRIRTGNFVCCRGCGRILYSA